MNQEQEIQQLKETVAELQRQVNSAQFIGKISSIEVTGGFISSASVANNGYFYANVNGKPTKITTTA